MGKTCHPTPSVWLVIEIFCSSITTTGYFGVAAIFTIFTLQQAGDVSGQFTMPPLTCPGDTFIFTCNVTGNRDGVTAWIVGSSECTLLHRTAEIPGPCGSGSPFTVTTATGFGTSATSFVSTLSGTATLALNGTLVECFGPAFSRDAENRVGIDILQIMGPPIISISNRELSGDVSGAVNVTVSWTLSGGDSADFYLINITTNAPQTPIGPQNVTTTNVTVTGFQVAAADEAAYEYNITVRGVNCDDQEGRESEPLILTLQVPDTPPDCIITAIYNQSSGKLVSIKSTWDTVTDPVNPYSGVTGNITQYQISFQIGSSVATENVNVTRCTAGRCNHTFEPPSNPSSSYDSVSVAAINVLGVGAPRTCTTQTISTTNSLLTGEVVDVSSPADARLQCTFLLGFIGPAHCTVQYGNDSFYMNLLYSAESTETGTAGDTVSVALRERLNSSTVYYYTVSAVSGDVIVTVQGYFTTPQYSCSVMELWDLPTADATFLSDVNLLDDSADQYPSCDAESAENVVLANIKLNTATVAYYDGTTPGSRACFVCNNGSEYELNTTTNSRVCQRNAIWSGNPIICVPHQLDPWIIVLWVIGVTALELAVVTGTIVSWYRKDKLKWWQIGLLAIAALAVVPGMVLIIIGIVVHCYRKDETKWWLSIIAVILCILGVAVIIVGVVLSNPPIGSIMKHLTTGYTMWIPGALIAVIIFTTGVLAGVLAYHCTIKKHQSESSKRNSSTFYQQQQAVSSSNPQQQTGPEYGEVIKLKQNTAYEDTQTGIEMRSNESYQPTQN